MNWKKWLRFLPLIAVVVWAATGFYTVEPEETAVVKRFGQVVDGAVGSGMHYRLPWPIETHLKFETTTVYKMGVGMITRDYLRGIPSPEDLSLWLTGDTNILSVKIMIQYQIIDLARYLGKIQGAQFLMAKIAEAVLTEEMAGMPVDDALTVNRPVISESVRRETQARLDELGLGIAISSVSVLSVDPPSQVIDVFRDVSNAAADRERIINEANGYANSVIPRARGEASWIKQRAQAARDARIAEATGQANRFVAVMEEYQKAPTVTQRRMYIESLEKILPRVKRYIVDQEQDADAFQLKILDLQSGP